MPTQDNDPLVSATWLAERLNAPDIRIVDATWFMAGDGRNARALFLESRIPGAVFFDIDEISARDTGLPHMLPAPEHLASRMRQMSLGDGARIVVYDRLGIFSSPRVWWTLRVMGVTDVAVLDGGLPAWEKSGFPLETGAPAHKPERHFTARKRADLVSDQHDVRRALARGDATLLDARSADRFFGRVDEPRPGLARGHMPGARNTPFDRLLTPDGCLRTREELRAIFDEVGADLQGALICTCGSGITAAIVALGLARVGRWDARIYDGSWAEWGALVDAPITTDA